MKKDKTIKSAAQILGSLGGRVRGPCKSRGSEAARKAAKARWEKYKALKAREKEEIEKKS